VSGVLLSWWIMKLFPSWILSKKLPQKVNVAVGPIDFIYKVDFSTI
jgi:hypothetical protein